MIKRIDIIYLIICIITVIQVSLYLNKDKEYVEVISNNVTNVKKNFRDIDTELNNIENLELLELKDDGESWSGKVLLTGSREEIVNSIELLNNYNINNYKIDGNANKFQVLLDIYR